MFRLLAVFFISVSLIWGVSGCGEKNEPAVAAPIKKTAPKSDAAPLLEQEELKKPEYATAPIFNPEGRRDPFVTFRGEADISPDEEALILPLQRYELSELRMVGVIWGAKGTRALIEDGAGIGHSIGVGDRLGRSNGVVTKVTDSEVIVKEEFPGVGGRMVTRESSLQLTSAGGQ
jgi:type IV pilus assembly protein PilP